MYLFRPLYRSKNKCGLIKVNKPISYTTARECIVKRLKLVAPELNLGLHSLRTGSATMATNSDINERCSATVGGKATPVKRVMWQILLPID